jgi:hypothetical protein
MKFILKAKPPNNSLQSAKNKKETSKIERKESNDEENFDEENIQWEDVDVKEFETVKLKFEAIPQQFVNSEFNKKNLDNDNLQQIEENSVQLEDFHEISKTVQPQISTVDKLFGTDNEIDKKTQFRETTINTINNMFGSEEFIRPGSFEQATNPLLSTQGNLGSLGMNSLFEKDFTSFFINEKNEPPKQETNKFPQYSDNNLNILDELFKTKKNGEKTMMSLNNFNNESQKENTNTKAKYLDLNTESGIQINLNSEKDKNKVSSINPNNMIENNNYYNSDKKDSNFYVSNSSRKNENTNMNPIMNRIDMNLNMNPNTNIINFNAQEKITNPQIPQAMYIPMTAENFFNPVNMNIHNMQNIPNVMSNTPSFPPMQNFQNKMNQPANFPNYPQINNQVYSRQAFVPQQEEEMTNLLENPNNIVQKNLNKRGWFLMADKDKILGNFNSIDLLTFLEEKIKSNYKFDNIWITDYDTDIYFTPSNLYEVLKENIPKIFESFKNKKNKGGNHMIPVPKINNNMIPVNKIVAPQNMMPNRMRNDNVIPLPHFMNSGFDPRYNFNNRNFEPPQMMNINLQVVKNNINFNNYTVSGQDGNNNFTHEPFQNNKSSRQSDKQNQKKNIIPNTSNITENKYQYDSDEAPKVHLGMYLDKNSNVSQKKKR